jgi:uncharacterized membrane protein
MTKTISFAVIHFSVAFSVAYIMTGSIVVGGAIALVEPAINTFAYHFHEKVWIQMENSEHYFSQASTSQT